MIISFFYLSVGYFISIKFSDIITIIRFLFAFTPTLVFAYALSVYGMGVNFYIETNVFQTFFILPIFQYKKYKL